MQTLFRQAGKLLCSPFYSIGYMAGSVRGLVDFKSAKSGQIDITSTTWMLGNIAAGTAKLVGATKTAAFLSPILAAWAGIALFTAPDPGGSLKQGYYDARGIEPRDPGNSAGAQRRPLPGRAPG